MNELIAEFGEDVVAETVEMLFEIGTIFSEESFEMMCGIVKTFRSMEGI